MTVVAKPSQTPHEGPASAAQEGIWLACQTPESARAYAIPLLLKISPSQPSSRIRAAVKELVDRHPALRTVFRHDGKKLIQVVAPHVVVALRETALESADSSVLRQLVESEAESPFDLASGPLFRAAVVQFGQEQYLALTFHHAVIDAWSLKIVVEDLTKSLAGVSHDANPVDELNSNELFATVYSDESLQYWRTQFATPPPHLPLCPSEFTGARTWRGVRHPICFDAEELAQLRAFARRSRSTLHMLMVSLCYAFLARWTRERDIVLGLPYADRSELEHLNVVGNFVNLLPLRYEVSNAVTIKELLGDIRNLCLDAFEHAKVPYSRIVDDAQAGGAKPTVQVVIGLHSELSGQARISTGNDVSVEWIDVHLPTAKFDIALSFVEREGGLEGWMEADTGVLGRQVASTMAKSFGLFVRAALTDQTVLFTDLPLWGDLSHDEVTGASTEFNRWGETLIEVFDRHAAHAPDALALISPSGELSYDGLRKRSLAWAGKLQEAGIGPGSLVALLVGRDLDLPVLFLGILHLGAAYMVIDPAIPDARAETFLEEARAALLVVAEAESCRAQNFQGPRIVLDAPLNTVFIGNSPAIADSIACVIYTSGTTGLPKGAEISHKAILRLLVDFPFAPLSAPNRTLANASPAFDAFTFELWGPLLNGGTAILSPRSDLTIYELEEFLVANEVNVAWLTSSYFNLIVDQRPEALASLNWLLVGGEALSAPRVCRLQRALPHLKLINGYGPTETTIFATCWSIPENIGDDGIELGKPTPHAEVHVVGEDGRPAPPGAVGEILVGGLGLAHGYRGQPGLTAERFIPNGLGPSGPRRLYRTGDLAVRTSDGRLLFRGRADDQIKIRGYRIEPGEIDRALGRIQGVREGVTICWNAATDEHVLISLVLTETGVTLTEEAIRHALSWELPSYMIPARVIAVEAWPLTPSGKLDRRALVQLVGQSAHPPGCLEGLTDTEREVGEIWRKLLRHPIYDRDQSFFELGGHSLLGLRMISEIRSQWNIELSLRTILKNPSLSGLSAYIDTHSAGKADTAPSLPITDLSIPQPASLEQERFWLEDQLSESEGDSNITLLFHLDEVPNKDALRDSLARLQERHAVLRTIYEFGSNGLVQRVLPGGASILVDAGEDLGYQDAVDKLERWGTRQFDLSADRQPRAALAQLRGGKALLGLSFHHIALDTLALSVLLEDLGHLYGQTRLLDVPQLAQSSRAYADYALAQRARAPRQDSDVPRAQSLSELVGPAPNITGQAVAGRIVINLPPNAFEIIRLGAATAGVSRFVWMLAAAARSLFATSDVGHLAIAVPVVDRPSHEFARTVGCFLNLRIVSLERPMPNNQVAFPMHVNEKWSDAQDEEIPFAKAAVAARSAAGLDLANSPFPVLFNFYEGEPLSLELAGARVQPLKPARVRPKAPLCIIAELHEQSTRLVIEYKCNLVAAKAAKRIAAVLQKEVAGGWASV